MAVLIVLVFLFFFAMNWFLEKQQRLNPPKEGNSYKVEVYLHYANSNCPKTFEEFKETFTLDGWNLIKVSDTGDFDDDCGGWYHKHLLEYRRCRRRRKTELENLLD
jgi:hypothetical protein